MGISFFKIEIIFIEIFRWNYAISYGQVQNVSEYDQEIPRSYTADQPTALWGGATEHYL